MSLIHNKGGLSQQFIETFIPTLRENCLGGMQSLLKYLTEVGVELPNGVCDHTNTIASATELTTENAKIIANVWENKEFQQITSDRGDEAQLQGGITGVSYYFKNAERFAKRDYHPTTEDMLKARRKTSGIIETEFSAGSCLFTLVDVGGQRSERKKWLHCFGSVSCVIFLTAINEFDMVLEEDVKTNRLVESLKLWKALTSSQFFKKTPFVLFLNKSDLFADKLKKTPLSEVFSDFEQFTKETVNSQLSDYEVGWKYILKQYQVHFAGNAFHPHLTCALDSEQCLIVFQAIQDSLFREALDVAQFR